eukprot:CAMPEP_0196825768 /NCGR_PEP_ID=MMETSP1362-20130617/93248_1 /TAXON_ID=163516 /ORGANISM="Leptocylindrus danicus, Strain CCMP1856" /LENGTH=251 /DNA_ID=CAMNT_0042206253 /DNA_START=31 /DNA_END=782 /DNA_ORIENTATION=-
MHTNNISTANIESNNIESYITLLRQLDDELPAAAYIKSQLPYPILTKLTETSTQQEILQFEAEVQCNASSILAPSGCGHHGYLWITMYNIQHQRATNTPILWDEISDWEHTFILDWVLKDMIVQALDSPQNFDCTLPLALVLSGLRAAYGNLWGKDKAWRQKWVNQPTSFEDSTIAKQQLLQQISRANIKVSTTSEEVTSNFEVTTITSALSEHPQSGTHRYNSNNDNTTANNTTAAIPVQANTTIINCTT